MITKTCIKCNIENDIEEFSFRKDTNKYRNCCKRCENERNKQIKKQKFQDYEWKIQLKELECGTCKIIKNIDCFTKRKDTELGVRKNCKKCVKQRQGEYYLKNSETLKKYQSEYAKNNRENIKNYYNNRRKNDPTFKLATNLRSRTSIVLRAKNVSKNKTFELIGCSQTFFKQWMEFQLYGEMTIENYGNVWQIDHTLPITSINLFNEDELRKCFNWRNLRPLYSKENISKGAKVDERLYLLQEIKAHYFLKLNGETVSD